MKPTYWTVYVVRGPMSMQIVNVPNDRLEQVTDTWRHGPGATPVAAEAQPRRP